MTWNPNEGPDYVETFQRIVALNLNIRRQGFDPVNSVSVMNMEVAIGIWAKAKEIAERILHDFIGNAPAIEEAQEVLRVCGSLVPEEVPSVS